LILESWWLGDIGIAYVWLSMDMQLIIGHGVKFQNEESNMRIKIDEVSRF